MTTKANDKIWVKDVAVLVDEPNYPGEWGIAENASMTGESYVSRIRPDCVLPDHPALPKVAAWLQAHFDEDKREALLAAFAGMCGDEDERMGYLRAVVGELIYALETA